MIIAIAITQRSFIFIGVFLFKLFQNSINNYSILPLWICTKDSIITKCGKRTFHSLNISLYSRCSTILTESHALQICLIVSVYIIRCCNPIIISKPIIISANTRPFMPYIISNILPAILKTESKSFASISIRSVRCRLIIPIISISQICRTAYDTGFIRIARVCIANTKSVISSNIIDIASIICVIPLTTTGNRPTVIPRFIIISDNSIVVVKWLLALCSIGISPFQI